MFQTQLIKASQEELALIKQLFAADERGIHQFQYGLTSSTFNNGNTASDLATPPLALPASEEERAFIASIFERLTAVIPIQATQVNELSSRLQIVSVAKVRDDGGDPDVTGITYTAFQYSISPETGASSILRDDSLVTVEAELNDDPGLSKAEQRTLVHEIGHVLGLDHHGGDPNDPSVSDKDTIMSYRVGGKQPATWFTSNDLQALQEIWGSASTSMEPVADPTTEPTAPPATPGPRRIVIDAITGQEISGFTSGVDQLLLGASLPGLTTISLRNVGASRKNLSKGLASTATLIYQPSSGNLYLNANGKAKGCGEGGFLASLGPGTGLAQADLLMA